MNAEKMGALPPNTIVSQTKCDPASGGFMLMHERNHPITVYGFTHWNPITGQSKNYTMPPSPRHVMNDVDYAVNNTTGEIYFLHLPRRLPEPTVALACIERDKSHVRDICLDVWHGVSAGPEIVDCSLLASQDSVYILRLQYGRPVLLCVDLIRGTSTELFRASTSLVVGNEDCSLRLLLHDPTRRRLYFEQSLKQHPSEGKENEDTICYFDATWQPRTCATLSHQPLQRYTPPVLDCSGNIYRVSAASEVDGDNSILVNEVDTNKETVLSYRRPVDDSGNALSIRSILFDPVQQRLFGLYETPRRRRVRRGSDTESYVHALTIDSSVHREQRRKWAGDHLAVPLSHMLPKELQCMIADYLLV